VASLLASGPGAAVGEGEAQGDDEQCDAEGHHDDEESEPLADRFDRLWIGGLGERDVEHGDHFTTIEASGR
jgi:hypothetical protein